MLKKCLGRPIYVCELVCNLDISALEECFLPPPFLFPSVRVFTVEMDLSNGFYAVNTATVKIGN